MSVLLRHLRGLQLMIKAHIINENAHAIFIRVVSKQNANVICRRYAAISDFSLLKLLAYVIS